MINRRHLLLSAAATAAAAPMLAQCAAAAASDADARLNTLLDGWFEADIDEAPERATNLGLDKDARAGLSSKLSEAGPDAIRKDREKAIKRWDELKAFDQKGLSEAGALNYAIAAFGRETAAQTARFDYGAGPGRPSPYVVTQLSGAYFSTPDFMDNQHRIEDAAGADAFLSRLEAFAGVWRLPDGEAFYAAGLKSNTTTTLSAKEIHAMGVEQVAEITAEIDGILKSQGMTQGTVGERVQALNKDPAQLFPNTDAGKEDLLKWLNEQVAALEPKLPTVFGRLPKTNVEIRRVPVSIQSGAPGGYYQGPPLDGSRPGAYYINLRDSGNWPKFALPTLTYHEASPGHHLQVALQRESGELPQWRRAGGFSAFNEGWALYAEAVAANDLDAYATDPLGRVGFLMSYLFRAVRLVVDTGIHSERWSRERAVEYMAASGAKPLDASNSEINRYSVWPGQACAYKVGHTVIARLREEAQAKDGFDLRAFHDKVLGSGSLPLAVLEGRMRA